jgi:hypothetical protein
MYKYILFMQHKHTMSSLAFSLTNAKPSKKDPDLPEIRTHDLWSSSQHTQPLHHLGCNHPKYRMLGCFLDVHQHIKKLCQRFFLNSESIKLNDFF